MNWASANSISGRLAAPQKAVCQHPLVNPKLINYLAAGSIQGLRPLRYEKRVARNRFFALAGSVGVILLGLFFCWLFDHRR